MLVRRNIVNLCITIPLARFEPILPEFIPTDGVRLQTSTTVGKTSAWRRQQTLGSAAEFRREPESLFKTRVRGRCVLEYGQPL